MSKWLTLALTSMREDSSDLSISPYAINAISAKRSEQEFQTRENNGLGENLLARAVLPIGAKRSENADQSIIFPRRDRFKGAPVEWLSGFDKLVSMPVPLGLDITRWLEVRADAERFLEQWCAHAAALGWDTLSIFGVCPDCPMHRTDLAGLIWMLKGRSVAAMTEHLAMIDVRRGVRQSFPRENRPGQVPIWALTTEHEHRRQEVAKHD